MPRSAPTILIETPHRMGLEQICAASTIFAVCYHNEPFNRRVQIAPKEYRYFRSHYTNRGYADHLAMELNQRFHCTDFSVREY